MKLHFWAGDFTKARIRKFPCGRSLISDLSECDEFEEFMRLPENEICISCRKTLARPYLKGVK